MLNGKKMKDDGQKKKEKHNAKIDLLNRAMIQEKIGKKKAVKKMVLYMWFIMYIVDNHSNDDWLVLVFPSFSQLLNAAWVSLLLLLKL